MKILNRYTGAVLFEHKSKSWKVVVTAAMEAKADLSSANLLFYALLCPWWIVTENHNKAFRHPDMTVEENLIMGSLFGQAKQKRFTTMDHVYLLFPRLKERRKQTAGTLSGGEQQRVAVARALMVDPAVVLADEPTGNLDTKNAQSIYDLFRELGKEENLTIIAATHNVKLAYQADRVVHLREGRIEKDEIVKH